MYILAGTLLNMESFFTVFLLTICFMVVFFVGISIKILLKKNGEFSGTCASQNPFLNQDGEVCGFCGALPSEKCKNDEINT